ncbi:MAG: hypothetical protein JWN15_4309 [Firmicutes bacterium]|jgi:hypothetical protein|nr:hypothetical protein [Bacillota bacterium]
MFKRLFIVAMLMALLTGCAAATKVGGTGSGTDAPSAGSVPPTITVKGSFAGTTDAGWVKIKVPETSTVLELELQKEVKPSFEAMKLKEGEAVWVHYYKDVPKIAGISRVNQ